MRKATVLSKVVCFLFSIALTLAAAQIAKADICVLSRANYTLAGTPCADAFSADGAGTDTYGRNIINQDVAPSTDVDLDVVFEQDSTTSLETSAFALLLNYDSSTLSSADCSVSEDAANYAGTTDISEWGGFDPHGFFDFALDETCGGTDNSGNAAIKGAKAGFSSVAPAQNFIVAMVRFSSSLAKDATTNLTFNIDDVATPTEINLLQSGSTSAFCQALVEVGTSEPTNGDCTGIPAHYAYTTQLTGAQATAKTDEPSSAPGSLSCKSTDPPTCTTSDASFTFTKPTTCTFTETSTTVNCSGSMYAKVYRSSPSTATYDEKTDTSNFSGTTFTDTGVGASGTSVSYKVAFYCTADATNGAACSESDQSSAITTECTCGNAPTVSAPTGFEGKTFTQGKAITIQYTITDEDADESGGIKDSIKSMVFYYEIGSSSSRIVGASRTAGATSGSTQISLSELSGTGTSETISVDIPKDYVIADTPIYFGLIVQDVDGLSGAHPTTFDGTNLTTVSGTTNMIAGTSIISASSFTFTNDEAEPYIMQFPYSLTDGSKLKVYFTLSDVASVSMRVYTLDGTLVRQIGNSSSSINDSDCVNCCNWETGCAWDGTGYDGNHLVANGLYIVSIQAVCTGELFAGSQIEYTKALPVVKYR